MTATLIVALLVVKALAVWGWTLAWRRRPRPVVAPEPNPRPGHYLVRWHSAFGDLLLYDGEDTRLARSFFTNAKPWLTLGVPKGGVVELWDGPFRRGVREIES